MQTAERFKWLLKKKKKRWLLKNHSANDFINILFKKTAILSDLYEMPSKRR